MVAHGHVTGLIDPACYYGHAEEDIAMLGLFDHPSRAFQAAYDALEPGYKDRIEIYRLWPALVHLGLFGDVYRSLVEGVLDRLKGIQDICRKVSSRSVQMVSTIFCNISTWAPSQASSSGVMT